MARKNQISSNKDRCDICGAALDDDSLVQEFPDGSVVALCVQCASDAAPEDEVDGREDLESDDATVEWAGPHDDNPTAPAPPTFEAEVFGVEDFEPHDPARPTPQTGDEAPENEASGPETPENGATRAEAELAAWASTSAGQPVIREDDSGPGEASDQEDLEEATLQLVAAIAEADMEEDERSQPDVDQELPSPPADSATEAETPKEEIIDRTKELLVPVTDLLGLQTEMQSALAKLSSTLEHFMTDMQASEQKTSAVNDRVQQLEDELESTRERLRAAQSLLPESAAAAMAAATATRDSDLLSAKPDEKASTEAGAALPSVPPPLPGSQSAPPPIPPVPLSTGASKSAASGPPPLGNAGAAAGTALGAAAGAALGAAAGAMVPPALPGLAAGAAAAAGAAVKPPSLGGADSAKGSPPPPSLPSTRSTDAPSTSPTTKPGPPSQDVPEETSSEDSSADIGTDIDAGADATSADEPLIAPIPSLPVETEAPASSAGSASGPVAGAAAAMQKLLRGRKGQQQPEPGPETEPEPEEIPGLTFTINEVQVAQRYFNESEFVSKLSEISRSIGKSQANVSRTSPGAPEAAVTVFWDIVWYQYIVDLRKELPAGAKRVVLMQEGMDLAELEPRFTEKNATVDDHGRLDASELEVRLLSDPDALISDDEASTPETRLAEDATEEIWDQRSAPEFRWD